MAEWVSYFNFAVGFSALTTALLGLLLTLTSPYVQRWERWFFSVTFMLLLAYDIADLVAQASLFFLGPDFLWLSRVGVFFELFFSTSIIPYITAYLLRCAGEDWRASALFRGAAALWAFYVVMLLVAQFGDAIYYISPDNRQILVGPLYPLLFVPPALLMALNLIALARRRSLFTRRQLAAIAIYTVVPLASMVVQALVFDLRIIIVGTNIAAIAMFSIVLGDQIGAYVRQREETAQQQAQVMALQMRPHFIYNVMTSIYYLCAENPARAQQVTLDFTNYLRANFDAVAQEGEVPFAKELEHTRAYLNVERARLEDGLVVDIDCPHMAFRLPPLTLQPLVENAIKHGADPELPPLYVRISTYEETGYSVATVEDTGPGFVEAAPADGSASALDNIRERLAACSSTLEVLPRRGGGTVAIIRIPSR